MEEESARRLRRSCQQPFALAQVQGTVLLLHFSLNIPLLPAAPAAAAPADTFASTADRTRCIHVAVMPSRTGVVPPRAGQARPSLSPPHRTAFPLPTHTPSRGLTFRIAGGAGTVPMAGQRVCVCVCVCLSIERRVCAANPTIEHHPTGSSTLDVLVNQPPLSRVDFFYKS